LVLKETEFLLVSAGFGHLGGAEQEGGGGGGLDFCQVLSGYINIILFYDPTFMFKLEARQDVMAASWVPAK
jgi:hypothetical protein